MDIFLCGSSSSKKYSMTAWFWPCYHRWAALIPLVGTNASVGTLGWPSGSLSWRPWIVSPRFCLACNQCTSPQTPDGEKRKYLDIKKNRYCGYRKFNIFTCLFSLVTGICSPFSSKSYKTGLPNRSVCDIWKVSDMSSSTFPAYSSNPFRLWLRTWRKKHFQL